MQNNNVTRGNGLLENFLAKKRRDVAKLLLKKCNSHETILDIGCGHVPKFLIVSDFKKKYGIDNSRDNFSYKDIQIKSKDLNKFDKLPFKDNFFDAVTMLAVIEHLPKSTSERLFSEIRRILKKNGCLIITTPTPISHSLLKIMAKFDIVSKVEINDHKHVYNENSIKFALKNSGFEESKISYGRFEFGLNIWFFVRK